MKSYPAWVDNLSPQEREEWFRVDNDMQRRRQEVDVMEMEQRRAYWEIERRIHPFRAYLWTLLWRLFRPVRALQSPRGVKR